MSVEYDLHHFSNFKPDNLTPIVGLAVEDELKKLAVLRKSIARDENAFQSTTIEIWNYEFINNTFFVEQRIYDDYKRPQLAEAIEWGKDGRLFTVGLNEKLNEINLSRGCIKKSYQLVSGPAYCMKFNKSRELVAVGTDDGYICVFNICDSTTKNEVNLIKNLKITSKVFSLDWFQRGKETFIVASTTDQIRIFNYHSGVQKDVIYFDSKDCHIWSVAVLPNEEEFIIMSGNSNGNVSFHDGSTCTQLKSFDLHNNDVVAICCKNGKRAFSIGVDGLLCRFSYLNGKVLAQSLQQFISEYELKSIASSEAANCLFIGGSDAELKRADPVTQSIKHFEQNFQNCVHVFDKYIMYQYEKSLKLYKLDTPEDSDKSELLNLGIIMSKKEIISSAIVKNFLVFADYHKSTILSRKRDGFMKLGIIEHSQFGIENVQKLILHNTTLYVQTSRTVHAFELSGLKNADKNQQLEVNKVKFKRRIIKMTVSKNYVTIILDNNLVEFYDLELSASVASLETKALPSIVEWQSNSIIWLLTNNNLYVIYDVVNKKILRCDELKELLGSEFHWRTQVQGLTFTPHSTIIYTKTRIFSINNESSQLTVNKKYLNILKLGQLNETEFYVVELPLENTIKHLPPKVYRKKYGVN